MGVILLSSRHAPSSSSDQEKAVDPVLASSKPLQGEEPEYEDIDKFAAIKTAYNVPNPAYIHMSSLKVPDYDGGHETNLTYDYAAV